MENPNPAQSAQAASFSFLPRRPTFPSFSFFFQHRPSPVLRSFFPRRPGLSDPLHLSTRGPASGRPSFSDLPRFPFLPLTEGPRASAAPLSPPRTLPLSLSDRAVPPVGALLSPSFFFPAPSAQTRRRDSLLPRANPACPGVPPPLLISARAIPLFLSLNLQHAMPL